jgi:hypothetical protein
LTPPGSIDVTNTHHTPTCAPAVAERNTVSRVGAPIHLERLTISQAIREAIERQFRKTTPPQDAPRATR